MATTEGGTGARTVSGIDEGSYSSQNSQQTLVAIESSIKHESGPEATDKQQKKRGGEE